MDILFSGATIVTMDQGMQILFSGYLGVTGKKIAYLGQEPPKVLVPPCPDPGLLPAHRLTASFMKAKPPFLRSTAITAAAMAVPPTVDTRNGST